MRILWVELIITPPTIHCCKMAHIGSVAVLTYMSRRSQRRRATISNDPFADLSENSRRRRQRFHDQQSRERDEFAWFLEATFAWQSPERMAVNVRRINWHGLRSHGHLK